MRTLAESTYVTGYAVVSSEQLLTQLDDLLTPAHRKLAAGLVELRAEKDAKDQGSHSYFDDESMANKPAAQPQPARSQTQSLASQSGLNDQQLKQSADEYQSRVTNAQQAQQQPAPQYAKGPPPQLQAPAPNPSSPPSPDAPAKTEVAEAGKSSAGATPAASPSPAAKAPAPKPEDPAKKADIDKLDKNLDTDRPYRSGGEPESM